MLRNSGMSCEDPSAESVNIVVNVIVNVNVNVNVKEHRCGHIDQWRFEICAAGTLAFVQHAEAASLTRRLMCSWGKKWQHDIP